MKRKEKGNMKEKGGEGKKGGKKERETIWRGGKVSKTANGLENWGGKAVLIWRVRRWQRNRGRI